MKKQLFLFAGIITTFVLVSCQKEISMKRDAPAEIESTFNNKGPKPVPFKGEYTTSIQVLSGPPVLRQIISGVGHATHLGESTFIANNTVYITPPPPFLAAGTATFVADNGDEFYTSFTGTSTPGPNGSIVVVTHTIIGGTGRFSDATGTFTGNTIAVAGATTGSITYDGNISF